MHGIAFDLMLVLIMFAGLANLFFPKRVMRGCEAFSRLLPFPNNSLFQGNVMVVRVSGAVVAGICLATLIGKML
jgi:hypothetical protein